MTGEAVGARTARAVSTLSSSFMLDGATYGRGAGAGFSGIDFYFAGRAGVLGDVGPEVVASAIVFFEPGWVAKAWADGAAVMPRGAAVDLFCDCAATWAGDHLDDDVDWARLGELARKVGETASGAGAPVFAAWRNVVVPDDRKVAALRQMNVLRELRMARHGGAVMAVGLDPGDAVRHHSPQMAGLFGWDAAEVGEEVAARWDEAESLTNRSAAHDYAALTEDEQDQFIALGKAALAAVH